MWSPRTLPSLAKLNENVGRVCALRFSDDAIQRWLEELRDLGAPEKVLVRDYPDALLYSVGVPTFCTMTERFAGIRLPPGGMLLDLRFRRHQVSSG
jgi:hypothetical protein